MENDQQKLSELWKVFGMESAVGKKLFNMYNKDKNKQSINYPQIKTKKPQVIQEVIENEKKIYSVKTGDFKSINNPNYNKKAQIDLIRRRKQKDIIDMEIENIKNQTIVPTNKGVDREKIITDFQNKIKKKVFPQKITENNISINNNENYSLNMKKQFLTKKLFGQNIETINNQDLNKTSELDELSEMFDELVLEIEEKQIVLEQLERSGLTELYKKTKGDIIERVSNLQKISGLMKVIKQKSK